MKVKDLIEKINSSDCYSIYDAIYMMDDTCKCIEEHKDVEIHMWYTVSTSVYKLEDGFVGIRGISELDREDLVYSDIDYPCTAKEYEEYTTISYRPKN